MAECNDTPALISREAAIQIGRKTYFTGNPCPNGHLCERYVYQFKCMECTRVWNAKYHSSASEKINRKQRDLKNKDYNRKKSKERFNANRDSELEKRRKRYARSIEKHRLRDRSRRIKEKEKRNKLNREWRIKNKEKHIMSVAEWRRNNPEKDRVIRMKRRAAKVGSPEQFTASELKALLDKQEYICANPFCRCDLLKIKKHLDHKIPLSRGGTNGIANLQYLCAPCNLQKNKRTNDEWMELLSLCG